MRILGLDTATRRASVALLVDGEILAERTQDDGRHAVSLLPLIQTVLDDAGCWLADLDAIAVASGPGSFTGLRVGLSVAKGLAWGSGAQLVGVPTLEALARTVAHHHGIICPLLDARKGELYAASFEATASGWRRLSDDALTTAAAFVATAPTPCVVLGDAVVAYGAMLREHLGPRASILPWETYGPRGSVIAALGAERLRAGISDPLSALEPFYIRRSEAELKLV